VQKEHQYSINYAYFYACAFLLIARPVHVVNISNEASLASTRPTHSCKVYTRHVILIHQDFVPYISCTYCLGGWNKRNTHQRQKGLDYVAA